MAKTYNEIIDILKEKDINFSRWYTIDQFMYVVFTDLNRHLIDKVKPLFVETDCFPSYNTLCIDMDKQPGEAKPFKYTFERRTRKERNAEIDNFNL